MCWSRGRLDGVQCSEIELVAQSWRLVAVAVTVCQFEVGADAVAEGRKWADQSQTEECVRSQDVVGSCSCSGARSVGA